MRKIICLLCLFILPLGVFASGAEKSCGEIECDAFTPDLHDKESMQRGAKYFVNYCMGCHAMQYMRYERLADDLGIPHEKVQEHLNFSGKNIGELMSLSATEKNQKKWFGATPPDLTLVSRARSPEWVYTYMRSFYRDDTRPYGVNNKVFKDVGMPHVMFDLQGLAECAPGPVMAPNGGIRRDALTREEVLFGDDGKPLNPCGRLAVPENTGSMSASEYDQVIADVVNFLAYAGEPSALKRERMGVYALLFVAFFFVVAWLLNREYWKNIH